MIFFRKKLISITLAILFFASGAHQLHAAKNSGPKLGLKKLMYLFAFLQGASANQIHEEADTCPANITTDTNVCPNEFLWSTACFNQEPYLVLNELEQQLKKQEEESEKNKWKLFFEQNKGKKKQEKCKLLLQKLLRNIHEEEEKERWKRNKWTLFFERNNGKEEQENWQLLLRYIKEKEKRTVQEDLFQLYDWTSQLYDWSKNKSHELATSAAANKTYEQIDRLYTWLKKQLCKSGCRPYDDE